MYSPRLPALPHALLLCLTLLLASTLHAESPGENWKHAGSRTGIEVWKRDVPDSPFVEFRAETTVRSSLSALLNLFYDIDAAPRWIDHTRRVVAVRRNDDKREYVLLLETDMPWPIRDRDAVLSGRWWQEPDSLTVLLRSRSIEGVVPVNPAYIRNTVRADWTFIPQGNGMVKVVMGGHVDPRGNLPIWAVNMLIQESPLATLANLRRIVGDPQRQAARRDDVTEPPPGFNPPR